MAVNISGRSFVSMLDLNPEELAHVLDTADRVKKTPGEFSQAFTGQTLAMIFQKPSLRTRISFEAGMTQMGGHAIYLAPTDISLGKRETTEDIALVLSRYADIIMARTFGHDVVEDLARHATVPVINGLSDREHPCQVLADLQTVRERKGKLTGLRFTYVGDGNNMAHSLMYGGALSGMHVTVVTPKGYEADNQIAAEANEIARRHGGSVITGHDPAECVAGADVVYTDVWASMGQEADAENRKRHFIPYQVNADLMANAKNDAIILHCLPAHYDEEITYDVTRTPNSAIFDQAENRLHAQKALMLLLAGR